MRKDCITGQLIFYFHIYLEYSRKLQYLTEPVL